MGHISILHRHIVVSHHNLALASLQSNKRIQKVSYCFFFPIKNTLKLINQQLKNGVKIVNWQKKVSYYFFYRKKYIYLKLKNRVKIIN